jgi:hypothetical protein
MLSAKNPNVIKQITNHWIWIPTEIIACIFWIFIATKPFLDLDLLILTNFFPSQESISEYRFFLYLIIAIIFLILYGRTFFKPIIIYIVFYPLVIIFWKIPKLLYKNWGLFFTLLPAIYSLFISLRTTLLSYFASIFCAFLILKDINPISTGISAIFLICFIIWRYYINIQRAYDSKNVFVIVANTIREFRSKGLEIFSNDISDSKKNDEIKDPVEIRKTRLTNSYVINYVIKSFSDKLHEITDNGKMDLFFISSLIWLVVLTVIIYGFSFLGIEKALPGSFNGYIHNSVWEYMGYSFSTLMTADISPIRPISSLAQIISYVELFSAIMLLIILVFVILTATRERYNKDARLVISELNECNAQLGRIIYDHLGISVDQLETEVIRLNIEVVNALKRLKGQPEIPQPKDAPKISEA